MHKRALIEPASAKKDLKRPLWGGRQSAGTSVLVCSSVRMLLIRGKILLPLPEREAEMPEDLLRILPDDFGDDAPYLRIELEEGGYSVVISTFAGRRSNEVLVCLFKNRLSGVHAVRVTDFVIRIFDFES